ncbi:PulJ/GspJ family protein [Litorilituus lipolyticus]|nr:prepilin-type N-terminal cleavage/methylation domain-containing protein [Litorilituus lipolyticus]
MRHNFFIRHPHQGFTLIEVLIASVILFAIITLLYQAIAQSTHSSDIARKNLEINSVMPLITGKIKSQLSGRFFQVQNSGEGELLGINYIWHAEQLQKKPLRQSFADQDFENYTNIFLWQVSLTLHSHSKNQTIRYQEVSWR